MRAINLTMQAFGPFKDKVNIDFEKFGKEGLFLISGQTGAGKTSIFDAISFALFGISSGGDRDEKMLRYTAADPEIETYVDLTFEYKGEVYNIRRTPRYLRKKSKGDGFTDLNTKKTLVKLPNGEVITNLSDADIFINELIGVDANQFSQISMLAQGDFMKLLKASSSEKVKLFRNIFYTENFQKLEDDIFNKLKEYRLKKEKHSSVYEEILSNFKIPEERLDDFNEVKNRSFEEIIKYIQDVNNIYIEISNKKTEEITKLSLIVDDKKTLLEKAQNFLKIKNNIIELTEKKEILKPKYDEIKEKYRDIENLEEEEKNIQKNINKIEIEIKRFEKLNIILEEIKNNGSLKNIENSKFENVKKEIELLKNKLLNIDNFISENEKTELQLKDIIQKIEDKKFLQDKILEASKLLKEIDIENKNKDNIVLDYEKIRSKKEEHYLEYKNADESYFLSTAGILAKNLVDGEECPVCGSIHHPNKASFSNDMISKEKLDKLKEKFELFRSKFEDKRLEIISKESDIKNLEKNLERILNELNISDTFDLFIQREKNEIELTTFIEEKTKLEKVLSDLEKQKSEKKNLVEKRLKKEHELLELKSKIISIDERIKNLQMNENEERLALGEKEEKDYKLELDKFLESSNNLKEKINFVRNTYQKINDEYNKLQTSLDLYTKQLDDKYDLDSNEIIEEIKLYENQLKQIREEELVIKSNVISNDTQLEKINKLNSDLDQINKKYNNLQDLNSVLKGQIRGLDNVRFETFVQIKYFDEILVEANKRFYKMTDGKYSLKRKEEANNMNEQTGLDFEVIDHQNKQTRNINTLSGGESFQAALSLALGLSDVVQMQKGGIELNSMFVDEGFGTLDRETLSKVMSTLSSISQYNKLIGIISHVEVLKEQIDNKIIVEKTVDGYSKISKQIY